MGGKVVRITASVPIGKSYDASVAMVAPSAPWTYTSYLQMADAEVVPLGKQVSVKIQVPASPTAVPPPTRTLAPGISFWADSYQIKVGQSTRSHWIVKGVKAMYYREDGQPEVGVTGEEDRRVRPSQSTSFYLRVVHCRSMRPAASSRTADARRTPVPARMSCGRGTRAAVTARTFPSMS